MKMTLYNLVLSRGQCINLLALMHRLIYSITLRRDRRCVCVYPVVRSIPAEGWPFLRILGYTVTVERRRV
jgi:hypothetical protein